MAKKKKKAPGVGRKHATRKKAKIKRKKFRVRGRVIRRKAKKREFSDPLAVPKPPNYLSHDICRKIMILKKTQYNLWSWAVALAILLLLTVTSIELLADFDVIPHPSPSHFKILELGNLIAIFIIGIELVSAYRNTKNKIVFLKQNWLVILAILPLGIVLRAGRIFEGLVIIEEFASLRTLQMAGKFGELQSILPVLEIPEWLSAEIMATRILRGVRPILAFFSGIWSGIFLASAGIFSVFVEALPAPESFGKFALSLRNFVFKLLR
ncbi:MAG: hypothetical protein ABIH83_02375 [Candidatus Micrarchaeota archaeon]